MNFKSKIISMLLSLILAFSVFTAMPITANGYDYDYKENGICYHYLDDLTARVDSYDGDSDSVIIPSNINDYRVTEIAGGAFADCKNIKSIVVPDTVMEIGSVAFKNCISLQNIDLGKGVTRLTQELFLDCISLESITIPEQVDHIDGSGIGASPFKGCTSLKTLNYNAAKSTSYYGDSFVLAFDLQGITTINIGSSVETIPGGFFSNSKNLKNVKIESGLKDIPEKCFYGCTNLTSVEFPDSIIAIGKSAFENCIKLTSVSLPKRLIKISENSFNNNSLTSVEIPQSVNYIGSQAFGYYGDKYTPSSKIPDFLIKGYTKSKAYDYAKENGFKFVSLGDSPVSNPTDPPTTNPTDLPVTTPTAPTEKLLGDADSDGEVNIKDATYIQLYLANLLREDEIDLTVCDIDNDSEINVKDATYIQLYLANLL